MRQIGFHICTKISLPNTIYITYNENGKSNPPIFIRGIPISLVGVLKNLFFCVQNAQEWRKL